MVAVGFARRIKLSPEDLGKPPDGAIDTTALQPFIQSLPVPQLRRLGVGEHRVVMREEADHRFHPALAPTKVWTYGSKRDGDGRYPPVVLIARSGQASAVRFENALPDEPGVEHPFIDLGLSMSTSGPASHAAMQPYPTGWGTPHLHGGHMRWTSDGHPVRVPGHRTVIPPRSSIVCRYPNDQPGTTLWFHDHLMGSTAANVYAGLVGMYLLRWAGAHGEDEQSLGLPADEPEFHREMPLVLGDRSFAASGKVIYGATFPPSPTPSPANPHPDPVRATDQASEFKGDCIIANGAVWPYLDVEPARYRFRIVNAASSRFFRLLLRGDATGVEAATPADVRPDYGASLPMLQIGGDGGFLPVASPTDDPSGPGGLVLAPGERADVVIDFSAYGSGTNLLLTNEVRAESDVGAPSLEGNGGDLTVDDNPAGVLPTGLVLQFRVRGAADPPPPLDLRAATASVVDDLADLRARSSRPGIPVRSLLLTETDLPDGTALPQISAALGGTTLGWYTPRSGPAAEVTALDAVEIWELFNNSPDTHPIHLHLVQFLVLERRPLSAAGVTPLPGDGVEPGERGWKDTLRTATNYVTRFAVRFTGWRGRYVWHCHILEHEDMGMMRPLLVTVGGQP